MHAAEPLKKLFERARAIHAAALIAQGKDLHIGSMNVLTQGDFRQNIDLVFSFIESGGALFVLDTDGLVVGQFGHFRQHRTTR